MEPNDQNESSFIKTVIATAVIVFFLIAGMLLGFKVYLKLLLE